MSDSRSTRSHSSKLERGPGTVPYAYGVRTRTRIRVAATLVPVPRGRDAQARVSVVIPVWDAYAGAGLVEAVASVRRQNVPVRVIVVDNASAVPLPVLGDVELVRLEQRRSTGAARNGSLPLLQTEYVVFLDADDRLLDGSIAALVAGLDADPRRATHTLS